MQHKPTATEVAHRDDTLARAVSILAGDTRRKHRDLGSALRAVETHGVPDNAWAVPPR